MPRIEASRLLATLCVVGSFVGAITVARPCGSAQKAGTSQRSKENSLALFRKQHGEMYEEFARKLEEIAKECAAKGLDPEAAEVRKFAAPLDTHVLGVDLLPTSVQSDPPAELPADNRLLRNRLRHEQQEYGKKICMLSKRALTAGHVSFAYDLVREVAFQDPDNVAARNMLGYKRSGDEWLTAYAAQKRAQKFVWTDRFGWIPKEHLARYENGERLYKNQWMSAAKEAKLRGDFQNAWKVETEHFLVATNHSLEKGVEIARQLEDYHRIFFQMFASFFNSPDQLVKLFEGKSPKRTTTAQKFDVNYFRTRNEYNQRLRSKIPQDIGITTGLYLPDDHAAFFFYDPSDNAEANTTIFHEATHQLFSESRPSSKPVGVKANFWIIEGIACYMESFRQDGGRISLGDPRYVRFGAAQYRYVESRFYIPLAKFAAMGAEEFKWLPKSELEMSYSQASGLTHFFLHYDDGVYREALIEHLSDIYSLNPRVRENPRGLNELTGVSYADLDRQYGKYIKQLDCGSDLEAADVRATAR